MLLVTRVMLAQEHWVIRVHPIGDLGTFIDKAGNVELARKLLSELTRDAPMTIRRRQE